MFGLILTIVALTGVIVAAAIEDRLAPTQRPRPPANSDERSTGGMNDMAAIGEFDYLTQMVPHNQEGVTAAEQLRRSSSPGMRRLGAAMVATQSADVARMKVWLAKWYPGRTAEAGYQPMMRDLSHLSGDSLDKTFLKDMISHHKVAVMLSQHLLRHGLVRHREVAAFAREVRDTQHAEISQMQRLLETGRQKGHHG
ncbi:DUF305 domain-containing protein [Streptosporangium sp. NPDC023825]|uniref:DUF305 domain-containing protein n=1 Tax=Streptosporangium sp. NPDC023825 TaxID=3154909 RepID=UPI0034147E8E